MLTIHCDMVHAFISIEFQFPITCCMTGISGIIISKTEYTAQIYLLFFTASKQSIHVIRQYEVKSNLWKIVTRKESIITNYSAVSVTTNIDRNIHRHNADISRFPLCIHTHAGCDIGCFGKRITASISFCIPADKSAAGFCRLCGWERNMINRTSHFILRYDSW